MSFESVSKINLNGFRKFRGGFANGAGNFCCEREGCGSGCFLGPFFLLSCFLLNDPSGKRSVKYAGSESGKEETQH